MGISFQYTEPRNQLETKGFVYTLRLKRKRVGSCWYNYKRGCCKQGDVYIEFIGDFTNREDKLRRYLKDSGLNSLKEWVRKAKKSRFLYKVTLLKFHCNECKHRCVRQEIIDGNFYGVYLHIKKDSKKIWVRRSCPDFKQIDIDGLI